MTDGFIYFCPDCRRAYYLTGYSNPDSGITCECGTEEPLVRGPQVR